MIQHRTILKVADNSGAKALMVIHVFGGSKGNSDIIGDVLNCVVKEAIRPVRSKTVKLLK